MAARKVSVGKGMTARERIVFEAPVTPDDQAAITEALQQAGRSSDLESVLADLEEVAAAILIEAGLPVKCASYELPNGGGCWGVEPLTRARGFEWDSPQAYAARVIDGLADVRQELATGAPDKAVLAAVRLGAVCGEAALKGGLRARGSSGGRPGGKKDERNETIAREYAARGRKGETNRARLARIGRKHKLGVTQTREAVKRGQELLRLKDQLT